MLSILFLSGCGSSVSIYHDLDPTGTFDQYKTYSFLDWTDGNKRTVSESEREKIRVALARELESMGFSFQEKNADIKVQATVYFRSARRHFRYHYHHGYPGLNYGTSERALAVDMFEGASKKHVWHSAAVGYIEFTEGEDEDQLISVAEKLFEAYPGKTELKD